MPTVILMVGLLQSWPVREASWAGYARQPIEFSAAVRGTCRNTNEVVFAMFDEPGLVIVDHLMIFRPRRHADQRGLEVARIPLDSRVGLSRNITPRFAIGSIVVLADHLTEAALAYAAGGPLPLPTNCKKCNHYNEYVGVEHLNAAGDYICASCR